MRTRRPAQRRFFATGRPSGTSRVVAVVVLGFLTAVFGFAALSQVWALAYGRVALDAVEGTATSCYGEGTRGQGCDVTYSLDGEDHSIPVDSQTLDVGDTVPLRVDPADPGVAYAAHAETIVFTVVLVLAAVALAGVVAYQVDELRTARR